MKNIFESQSIQLVCKRAIESNTYIKGSHVSRAPKLRDVAYFFIENYRGQFPFLLSLQEIVSRGFTLTDTQLASALNCCVHQYKRHLAAIELRQVPDWYETDNGYIETVFVDSGIEPTEEEIEDFVVQMESLRGEPDFPTEVDPRIHTKYRSFY